MCMFTTLVLTALAATAETATAAVGVVATATAAYIVAEKRLDAYKNRAGL